MNECTTQILAADDAGIAQAATLLQAGSLVAFPTETVYGLGADARNGEAVAGIYSAKGRPSFNPLIVHVADVGAAKNFTRWSDAATLLSDAFWPGALTLVLPLRKGHGLSSLVTAGLETVAVRMPNHPTAQALLAKFGGPVAAPSANPSGQISPTKAAHVKTGLDGRIAAILDNGPCSVGVESTIIDLSGPARLLRPGGISQEAIEAVLHAPLLEPDSTKITAPGQLASHYAPQERVRLNATHSKDGEILLGFGDIKGDICLSASGDLAEAAANLFDALHQLDAQAKPIAVAPIPHHGLGAAINDRLTRAAAPKD